MCVYMYVRVHLYGQTCVYIHLHRLAQAWVSEYVCGCVFMLVRLHDHMYAPLWLYKCVHGFVHVCVYKREIGRQLSMCKM